MEKTAPWRDTPLDHWSTAIDPSVMAGDQWVEPGDPGEQIARDLAQKNSGPQAQLGRFQHPQHDTSVDRDLEM